MQQSYAFTPLYYVLDSVRYKTEARHLDHVPRHYYQFQDLSQVAKEVWQLVVYSTHSLTADKDIANDFCLYFYEKLPNCLEVYRKNMNSPFAPFLVRFLKFQFYNYIRSRRSKSIEESLHSDLPSLSSQGTIDNSSLYTNNTGEKRYSFEDALDNLPIHFKLLLKLYFGVELKINELKILVNRAGCPKRVADFLQEGRQQRERKREKLIKHQDYVTHLNTLLFKAKTKGRTKLLQHKKHKIEELLKREKRSSCEMSRIARLFGVSRATMSRRFAYATRCLSQEIKWN